MPTYEYRCENGHRFEEFQSILAEPIQVCPVCGAKAVRLISGGTGLIFRGSGFYITDYAKKDGGSTSRETAHRSKPAESEKAAPSDTASKTESPAPSAGKKDD